MLQNIMKEKYVGGKEASKILGVHQRTLYQWDKKKLIEVVRTPGGKRMYNVEKYLKDHKDKEYEVVNIDELDKIKGKLKIGYVKVSSKNQINDLEHQKKIIKDKYPDYLIIEDIGSGVDLNRKGLRKIIKLAIDGRIEEIVVAYKDRLTRFGYDLVEDLVKEYSNGKIIIVNKKDDKEPEGELMEDLLQTMNVFVTKMNKLRKYQNYKSK